MPLILTRPEVLDIYAEAAARNWVHPSVSTENVTTTEAILAAAKDYGEEIGQSNFAITIAITHRYPERPQTIAYSPTGDAEAGMRLFHADLAALMHPSSPYAHLRVLVHLDHGQFDADGDVLDAPEGVFSSVMYDASALPFDENIIATRRYVDQHGGDVVIEGACDTIAKAGEREETPCTAPDDAERYFRETGVDWVVANVGTEHRAGISTLRYRADVVRDISKRIGKTLSLHGTSSVLPDQMRTLFSDGVGKANFWTALERDSSGDVLEAMTRAAGKCVGPTVAGSLLNEGLLGPNADVGSSVSIDFCTTKFRQAVVFASMRTTILKYLSMWCPVGLAEAA